MQWRTLGWKNKSYWVRNCDSCEQTRSFHVIFCSKILAQVPLVKHTNFWNLLCDWIFHNNPIQQVLFQLLARYEFWILHSGFLNSGFWHWAILLLYSDYTQTIPGLYFDYTRTIFRLNTDYKQSKYGLFTDYTHTVFLHYKLLSTRVKAHFWTNLFLKLTWSGSKNRVEHESAFKKDSSYI